MSRETIACVSPDNLDQHKGFLFDNLGKKIEVKINQSQLEFDTNGAIKIKEDVLSSVTMSHNEPVGEFLTNIQVNSQDPSKLQFTTKVDNSSAHPVTKEVSLENTVNQLGIINNFVATVNPVDSTLTISLDQGMGTHKQTYQVNHGRTLELPTVTVYENSSKSNFITVQEKAGKPTVKELYVPVPDVKLTDAFGNTIGYIYSEEQVTRINNHSII